jgi:uncharacterized protein (UPF0335 family)
MNKQNITAAQLKSYIERIERLEEEKAQVADEIKSVYAEAKAEGYDTKIMKQVIRVRKMDEHEFAEQRELLELYFQVLGESDDMPKKSKRQNSTFSEMQMGAYQ